MPPRTALPAYAKPNQQLIEQGRHADDDAVYEARLWRMRLLGWRTRRLLADTPLPLLGIRTTFSLLRGTASPALWREALSGLWGEPPTPEKDRRGANHPGHGAAGGAVIEARRGLEVARTRVAEAPAREEPVIRVTRIDAVRAQARRVATCDIPTATLAASRPVDPRRRAILADRDDLLGLPACIDHWGRDRVGVGAVIELGDGVSTRMAGETLLLAPTADAYAALSRLLSWHHEETEGWRRWNAGGAGPPSHRGTPACAGLIALVREEGWGRRLAALGAEVWWRAGLRPQQTPVPFPIAAAPILAHLCEEDARAAPTLAAIREQRTVRRDDAGRAGAGLDQLPLIRGSYRGYEDQLERGAELAARCRWLPGGCDERGEPILQLPPPGAGMHGRTDVDPDELLRREAEAGLPGRYPPEQLAAARERLDHELGIIKQKRFATYILTVREMTQDRRTCGRGSAASSIVCYSLGMTNVDPLRWNLVFERFLAPDRTDPPDIDIDFAWDERDAVQARTIATYGVDHVAMVATHQAMHRWAALREAARAHGLGDGAVTEVRSRLRQAETFALGVELPAPWPAIIAAAEAIAGAPRHLGLHCGGVLITEKPIREIVPVHPAAKTLSSIDPAKSGAPTTDDANGKRFHVPTIAWEKDGSEDLGLVKIDVLGNRSLAVIRDCLDDLKRLGTPLAEEGWDAMTDGPTKAIVASGATMGCFYIESPAMRQLQARVGSDEFDRLVVHSSIIRPAGALFIGAYVARYHEWKKQGGVLTPEQEAEWYPHPAFKNLLSASFGVLSYQEDVMQISQALAGFTSKEANQLRKALGRSDTAQRLFRLAGRFWEGCRANKVDEPIIDLAWRMITSFAGYSFCKAHSASYAAVSFQCAYLKAHHPATFMARVIHNQGGYYDASAYVEEARRLNVTILAPCVLASEWDTRCENEGAIRLGLELVKGLSQRAAERIVSERARPFRGLRDLRRRCGVASDELRALCDAGALDALTPALNHAQRAWLATVVAREREAFIHPASVGAQAVLDLLAVDIDDPAAPLLRDLPLAELRRRQWAVLGVLADAHPLCLWRLPPRALRCRDIVPARKGERVTLIARSITRKQVSATYTKDRQGNPLPQPEHDLMSFVTMEDETALVETVWFPEAYRAYGPLLMRDEPLRLRGTIDEEFGVATLTVERAEPVGR